MSNNGTHAAGLLWGLNELIHLQTQSSECPVTTRYDEFALLETQGDLSSEEITPPDSPRWKALQSSLPRAAAATWNTTLLSLHFLQIQGPTDA